MWSLLNVGNRAIGVRRSGVINVVGWCSRSAILDVKVKFTAFYEPGKARMKYVYPRIP